MKSTNLRQSFGLVYSVLLLFLEGSLARAEKSTPDFTVEEAKVVWEIVSFEERNDYLAAAPETERILSLIRTNENQFLLVLAVDALFAVKQEALLEQLDVRKPLLKFVIASNKGDISATKKFLEESHSGQKYFFQTWLAFRGKQVEGIANSTREATIMKHLSATKSGTTQRDSNDRISQLFSGLQTWNSPMEYEACMLEIVSASVTNREAILPHLVKFIMGNVPESQPPPYTRRHTLFAIGCRLSQSIGGPELEAVFLPLDKSETKFVSGRAKEVLIWLKAGVRYPLRYAELRRAFVSQN